MKQKVALVLSGGGARGFAHIGVIEELVKQGYEITSIAGTSMGSVIGGVYALGKMDVLKDWAYTMDKRKIFSLVDFTLNKHGMVRGDKVFKKMKKLIPDDKIENLPIPYAAVATDMIEKKEVVFTEGSVYDAIRASVSIPTVFTPVKSGHKLMVDGGVLNNIPINHVKRRKGDILVAVNVNSNIPLPKPEVLEEDHEKKQSRYNKRTTEFYKHLRKISPAHDEEDLSYFNLISRTIDLMTWRIDELSLAQHQPDMLIEVSREASTLWDFYKAEELVELGRRAAIEKLAEFS
jgi:NTE family protein